MAFDFPSSPTVNQVYQGYTWDGEKWVSGALGTLIYVADSAPAAPDGALWWESDSGILFFKYNDGNSSQWVAISDGGAGAVRYDTPQSLTAPQQVQARQNIYATPFDAMSYNGMQVNGSFDILQERAIGASITGGYVADGSWYYNKSGTMVLGGFIQNAGVLPAGFTNRFEMAVSTAQASLGAGDHAYLLDNIEGYRIAKLGWGTANAQPITIGFWTAHHRTGLWTGTAVNFAQNRSYAFSYTQAIADVWQYNVITIPGDTTGTWNKDNTIGITFFFSFGSGATFTAPSLNTWAAGNYRAGPGQVNGVGATSDVFRFTGFIYLPGIEAPSAARSPFIMRPFDQELITCKRYYTSVNINRYFISQIAGSFDNTSYTLSVPMRANPTLSPASVTLGNVSSYTVSNNDSQLFTLSAQATAAAAATSWVGSVIADARL